MKRNFTGFVCVVCLVSLISSSVYALQPPTAEQVAQYKAEGSFAERAIEAERFGNHKMDPYLTAKFNMKVKDLYYQRLGIVDPNVSSARTELAPPSNWQGGMPSTGNPKVFVLLVDFPDTVRKSNHTQSDIESKFFGSGDSSEFPYDSVKSYYQRSSYNKLNIDGTVFNWYTAANTRSHYEDLGFFVGNETLIMEAIEAMESAGHDFTQYDGDNNGTIDAFFIKWTGGPGAWASFWWAYQTSWHIHPNYRVDGKSLGKYVWSWIAYDQVSDFSPHVDIHETGHLLGLPDYYDYDGSVGVDGGVGSLDMMDGNWGDHNCFSKSVLEWMTPTVVTQGMYSTELSPSGTDEQCILAMPDVDATQPDYIFDEYFMIQYRKQSAGNDKPYPTDGLLVWHIDATLNSAGNDYEYDNSYTDRKLLRLMEADGLEQIENDLDNADAGDFYTQGDEFSPVSTPNSNDYDGNDTEITLNNIGSAGATIPFDLQIGQGGGGGGTPPTILKPNTVVVDAGLSQTILLIASDDGQPAPVKFIVTSLPAYGTVQDVDAGMAQITTVPHTLASGQVQYTADIDADGADSFTVKANDGGLPPTGGDSAEVAVDIEVIPNLVLEYQYPPVFEDFEDEMPNVTDGWVFFSSKADGFNEVVEGKLRMAAGPSEVYTLNEAILHLNLARRSYVYLSFYQSESGDENHYVPAAFYGHSAYDGVSVSNDGENWHTLVNTFQLDAGGAGRSYHVMIDDLGLEFTEEFQIKFQQYDNYQWPMDGREFDDIQVYVDIPADYDGDGYANGEDLQVISKAWGTVSGDGNFNSACDLAAPFGAITATDLAALAESWLR